MQRIRLKGKKTGRLVHEAHQSRDANLREKSQKSTAQKLPKLYTIKPIINGF